MNFNNTFVYTIPDVTIIFNIKRILPADQSYKSFKLIPIDNSAFFYFGNKITKDPLILPKLYSALTYLTGDSDSDDFYDSYKGSFSFTFEVDVNKNDNCSKYYYHLYHYRSYVEFKIYLITTKTDPRDEGQYVQPDDMLFSDKDICGFSNFFCLDAIKRMEDLNYTTKSFIKYSNSNLLLFGYNQDQYFFEEFDDQEKYEKKKKLLEKKINKIDEL